MILALQCHEARARNSGSKLATRLERLHLVFALMHNERRHGDLRQQLAHIQVSCGLEITIGAFGCSRLALPLGEFLKLFLRSLPA